MRKKVTLALALTLVGCGENNLNGLIFGGGGQVATDTMFIEAQSAYDRGDFEEAEKIAVKLLARNPRNESAAVLMGYIALSRGGIDPFRLARELIALSEKKANATTTGTGTGQSLQRGQNPQSPTTPTTTPTTTGSSTTNTNASDTLRELASIISLTEADFVSLQKGEFEAKSELFATTPIRVPADVNDALRDKIAVLKYMNLAVKSVCRFVSPDVKISGEERHDAADCATYDDVPNENRAKATFLWAFSHLTEALVYQSVLLYASAGSSTSNFEVASQALNNGTFEGDEGFDKFVAQVDDMKTAVDLVFDTASPTSMISATLRDMDAVNRAFGQLAGLPSGITTRISAAMAKIVTVGAQVGADGQQVGTVGALKGQMTEKLTKTVGGKIDTVITAKAGADIGSVDDIDGLDSFPAEEKTKLKSDVTKMCDSYDNLSKGSAPEFVAANKPGACS